MCKELSDLKYIVEVLVYMRVQADAQHECPDPNSESIPCLYAGLPLIPVRVSTQEHHAVIAPRL